MTHHKSKPYKPERLPPEGHFKVVVWDTPNKEDKSGLDVLWCKEGRHRAQTFRRNVEENRKRWLDKGLKEV